MPHTLPPAVIETTAVHPVLPSDKEIHYTTGDTIKATQDDAAPRRPAALSRTSSSSEGRSRSPLRALISDPFFKPESRSASREPGRAEQLQREAAMSQVRAAQDASYEADLERAVRRSERDQKRSESHSRSGSHHRGLDRIRAAIQEIVNDPFWHRPTKEEANDPEYMRRIIMDEVTAARASTDAASRDREARHASRSRSRVRSPLASPPTSQPGSRSQSRVRQIVGSMLGGSGGSHDRGAAGFGHAEKETDVPATVKE
ncbi:hypothetical protein JCM1841_001964 [Sporobolomyces salmonicolor]